MFWKNKKRQQVIYSRSQRKRKNFFQKKEEVPNNPIFLRAVCRLLVLFFIAAVFYVLFFSPFLEIKKINLEGISELSYAEVYQKLENSLEGKYFRLIPRNNLISVSKNRIKNDLKEKFKKIDQIEIAKEFPETIKIKITERKNILIWCSAGPCYIVDEQGYAYNNADFESEEIKQNHLINLFDDSGKPVVLGEKVLDSNYIFFITEIKDVLDSELGIEITENYHTQSRIAEEIRVENREGWGIYFSTSFPFQQSVRTLRTFLDKEIDQNKRMQLEYVDLRAENKVYYKFKEESQENSNLDQADQEKNKNEAEAKKENKKKD